MKSFVALSLICLTALGTVHAQATIPQNVEQQASIDNLATQLGLTVEQKANVDKTLTAFNSMIERIEKSGLNEADQASKITAITSRMNSNIKAYLTEEQFSKYEKITGSPDKF